MSTTIKATRFMRRPFFVAGYKVTEQNMAAVAKWCQGSVVNETDRPFVRVPVTRETHERQTKAFVGMWVLVSVQRGKKGYKAYTEEWLELNFIEVIDEMDPKDMEIVEEEQVAPCCNHPHGPLPPPSIPLQRGSSSKAVTT